MLHESAACCKHPKNITQLQEYNGQNQILCQYHLKLSLKNSHFYIKCMELKPSPTFFNGIDTF